MEWKVALARDAEREIANADWPAIRMFSVEHQVAREPQRLVGGQWRSAQPSTVHDFSAVGYFFARELYRAIGVPVGIIDASWGGTPVEAWTSIEALKSVMDVDGELRRWASSAEEIERIRVDYERALVRWEEESLPTDLGNVGEGKGWASPDFDDDGWPVMPVPGPWQSRGLDFNGVVWFRKTIDIPSAWAGHDLVLSLGAIDDFDHTYFNGSLAGAHPKGTPGAYRIPRHYQVSGARVRPGKNVIAVRVFDHFGEGGLLGPAAEMFLETKDVAGGHLPLSGGWRYAVERRIPFVAPGVFRTYPPAPPVLLPQNAPSALFSGMIAPLLPFGLRGVIWYQGESNVEGYRAYTQRFVAMIRDWRARFQQRELPFYFTQLANYAASPAWPYLREAQAGALSEVSTAMAVAIDIGDPNDIHPRNKQEVARRLSLLALARTYGKADIEASGPTFARVEWENGAARVHFRAAKGLASRGGGDVRGFALAGGDGVYHAARARIDGETVIVQCAAVPAPETVRYAWEDNPDADLVNAAGLPAAPFRTDDAPGP
jgi:sialate O-acetylesterase